MLHPSKREYSTCISWCNSERLQYGVQNALICGVLPYRASVLCMPEREIRIKLFHDYYSTSFTRV